MKLQNNPFRYGSIVDGAYYCDRGNEHALAQHLLANNKIYVKGRRRTGKSSFVQESIRRCGLKSVSCHFGKIVGVEDVVNALAKALESNQSWLSRVMKSVSKMRMMFTFPNAMQPDWGLKLVDGVSPKAGLDALLDAMEQFAPKDGMVVYLDEFQQILKIQDADAILWEMRNAIQYHQRCRYVFAGSVKTIMDSMFLDSAQPFFNSAVPFPVGAIDKERYWEFVAQKNRETGREIEKAAFERVYDFSEGVVGDAQELFSEAWNQTVAFITIASIEDAVKVCVERKKGLFMALCSRFSERQMRVLRAVATMGAEKPTSAAFLKASRSRSPSYIKATLQRFVADRILTEEFAFENPFFREWIRD